MWVGVLRARGFGIERSVVVTYIHTMQQHKTGRRPAVVRDGRRRERRAGGGKGGQCLWWLRRGGGGRWEYAGALCVLRFVWDVWAHGLWGGLLFIQLMSNSRTYIHVNTHTPTSQFGYYGGYPGMRGAEHVQCSQQ